MNNPEVSDFARAYLEKNNITWYMVRDDGFLILPSYRVRGVFFKWLNKIWVAAKLVKNGKEPSFDDETLAMKQVDYVGNNLIPGRVYLLTTYCLMSSGACLCGLRENNGVKALDLHQRIIIHRDDPTCY